MLAHASKIHFWSPPWKQRVLVLFIIVALLISACGDSGDSSETLPDTTPSPDLAVSSLTISPDPPTTAGFVLHVTVTNTGLADSTSTSLDLYLQNPPAADAFAGTYTLPVLPAVMGAATVDFTFTGPALPAGVVNFRAHVMLVPLEQNYSNNDGTLSVAVAPAAGG